MTQRTPPKATPELQRPRTHGLNPVQAEQLRRAIRFSEAGDRLMAGQTLFNLSKLVPGHPEVLRWQGVEHAALGDWAAAAACLVQSAAQRPGDFEVLRLLAAVQNNASDFRAAAQSLQGAQACAQGAAQWLALMLEFDRQGRAPEALAAAHQLLVLDPASSVALLQRARSATALGDAAAAAADCRSLIARQQHLARAWFSLVDLKTLRLSQAETQDLERDTLAVPLGSPDRVLLDFALGKALEDAGQVEKAFNTLVRANAAVRANSTWDAAQFTQQVLAVRSAFSADVAAAPDPRQGQEIIFLVGLPRSGTTLVEQVLASHSQVEGASELPYLRAVVDEESRRLSKPFPTWVGAASPADWARMGQRYLALSARWRAQRPVATDKLPENWLLAGAALAMLPGARVIDCRRDAVETCWSCFKQLFGPGHVGFTYSLQTLAAYWCDYDSLCRFWAQRFGARFYVQHYESLVAEPEAQIRSLLSACGLAFEVSCLQFHKAQRAIRTPSALQVRQPLHQASTPAAQYGALLDPLRHGLGDTAHHR
jgi:tetratricopeptide (TPR) repeat protein